MAGWPPRFWQSWREPRMHFVVLSALPETPGTLLLRVFGRGITMARAVAQLDELPAEHVLRDRLQSALIAFEHLIMQNSGGDMQLHEQIHEQIRERYETWKRRAIEQGEARGLEKGLEEGRKEGREEALRDVLIEQMKLRFGEVPESASARIEVADPATLMRWATRVLTAASLDDVLG